MEEPPCKKCCRELGGCLRACLDRVNEEARTILQQKLELEKGKGLDDGYAFIRKYMRGRQVTSNHARNGGRRRHFVWRYLVPSNGKEADKVEVCQLAFRKIFNVSERFIRTARDKRFEKDIVSTHLNEGESASTQINGVDTGDQENGRDNSLTRQDDPTCGATSSHTVPSCPRMPDMKNICNWSTHQISNKTLQILLENGFSSRLAIAVMCDDDLKYLRKKTAIKPGQISLLRHVVTSIKAGDEMQKETRENSYLSCDHQHGPGASVESSYNERLDQSVQQGVTCDETTAADDFTCRNERTGNKCADAASQTTGYKGANTNMNCQNEVNSAETDLQSLMTLSDVASGHEPNGMNRSGRSEDFPTLSSSILNTFSDNVIIPNQSSSPSPAATVIRCISSGLPTAPRQTPFMQMTTENADLEMQRAKMWYLTKEIDNIGVPFNYARNVAVSRNEDIIVVDSAYTGYGNFASAKLNSRVFIPGVFIFNKSTLHVVPPNVFFMQQFIWPTDVAITSHGNVIVVDRSKYVKMFNTGTCGVYSRSFCTLAPTENECTPVDLVSVAVSHGRIFVGYTKRELVTIHDENDGNIIGKVNIKIAPYYLAVTSNKTILVSDIVDHRVVSVDFSGRTVFCINIFVIEGMSGYPCGIACDNENNVYIAVKKPANKAPIPNAVIPNTGHIHMYNNEGEYIRCIVKGLFFPLGITWFNGSLYVANKKSVLVYSTE